MKKFYLGALGCLLAMGASAQKVEQVGTMQGGVWSLLSIPTEYAYEGKSSVYTVNETETDVEFTVYNKSFAVDRTIKVTNPTSYKRTVVESREAVMVPVREGKFDCGYKTLDVFYDGSTYYGGTKSYPHWWAVNKCTNTTYTDEYVDEWIEYNGIYYELVEKREYDGGTLFVTDRLNSYYETYCHYFKNNKLYACYYDTESGVLTFDEEDDEIDEYYDFYNTQLAIFSQEDITEYINQGDLSAIRTESGKIYFSGYQVTSTETEADGSIVFLTNTFSETTELKFIWNKNLNTLTAVGAEYKQTYTGEWKQELKEDSYSEEENEWLWDVQMSPFCVGEIIGEIEDWGIYATQTLFNNDAKWEFLRPLYTEVVSNTRERDRDNDGEVDYKEIRNVLKIN